MINNIIISNNNNNISITIRRTVAVAVVVAVPRTRVNNLMAAIIIIQENKEIHHYQVYQIYVRCIYEENDEQRSNYEKKKTFSTFNAFK